MSFPPWDREQPREEDTEGRFPPGWLVWTNGHSSSSLPGRQGQLSVRDHGRCQREGPRRVPGVQAHARLWLRS